jgi:hypothetical protein
MSLELKLSYHRCLIIILASLTKVYIQGIKIGNEELLANYNNHFHTSFIFFSLAREPW